jgi:alpha-D-ribose 1-methylphosphonate 5-triphosphate synthase subunit PhnG
MKTNFRTFVMASAVVAAAAMATIPAVAADTTTLKVPFGFTVNGRSLPAGEYSVVRSNNMAFVRLQSTTSSDGYSWVASPSAEHGNLVTLKFNAASHALQSVQYGPMISPRLDKNTKANESVSAIEVGGR